MIIIRLNLEDMRPSLQGCIPSIYQAELRYLKILHSRSLNITLVFIIIMITITLASVVTIEQLKISRSGIKLFSFSVKCLITISEVYECGTKRTRLRKVWNSF